MDTPRPEETPEQSEKGVQPSDSDSVGVAAQNEIIQGKITPNTDLPQARTEEPQKHVKKMHKDSDSDDDL